MYLYISEVLISTHYHLSQFFPTDVIFRDYDCEVTGNFYLGLDYNNPPAFIIMDLGVNVFIKSISMKNSHNGEIHDR